MSKSQSPYSDGWPQLRFSGKGVVDVMVVPLSDAERIRREKDEAQRLLKNLVVAVENCRAEQGE